MKKQVLVFGALLAVAASGSYWAQAPAANRAATEKQILTMERAVNEAVAKGDMKAFHANVAAETIGVDSGGITKVNAPDFDKMIQENKIQTWDIDMPQFSWIDDNNVMIIYRWTGKGTFQGQPIPSPVWTSTLWHNKGGKWTAVFHQESVAMTPTPAPKPAATPNKK